MPISDLDQVNIGKDQELKIQLQIAFAAGIFQGDVTVRTLLESLAEGVVVIDNSGTILLANTSAEKMFGYPKQELIGKPNSVLIPERFRTVHEKHMAHYFEAPRISPMGGLFDLAGRRQDGSEFPLEISLSFIETINGILVLVLFSDITLRKQAGEEINILNTNLKARASELEAANQMLEAFNYTVAHDLRKPLNVINGYCQAILNNHCGNNLDDKCKVYFQETYNGTLRMNRLIEALLNFSRLTHIELRRETVDLSAIAEDVTAELRLADPKRRVTFRAADGAIRADGDADLLRLVLDNLLGNAWKYTGAREEAIIEFGATEINGKPVFFVRDNGEGFDMADADKLFILFQPLPGAEEFKGFGTGLATVERIIKHHGGKVWAEGEPGKGATFFFTL